ncbi:hypothetical protein, variant [Aphanomyces invadans]|uniref:Calcineurin-like phosphoesterase domain-containing protein n=1 Tax=Aphanomyces invadans TaxID=157072 RepID=A0A024UNZ3_9STRA|nr:hypothetical protein, variant [Aphanomyces invadans]ETW08171.1 hypothetical protein, variant [Aphanomyces invadans]|eukprot:XP_008864264.1 hypothetical protein, variant [Aphanomyces invadans]
MPRFRSQSAAADPTSPSNLDLEDGQTKDSSGKKKSLHNGWRWRIRAPFLWGVWAVVFTWGELGASRYAFKSCTWAYGDHKEYHLAVIADPQLTDFYSYDMVKGSWVLWLTEFYSDLYMRRHFQLLARKADPPHGVLLLGDLFDGGRVLSTAEHAKHQRRFEWIFGGHPKIQFWNMSGNHDVGIRQWNSPGANARHQDTFGLTQYTVVLGHIEVVVVDAVGMLSNDPLVQKAAIDFVTTYGSMKAKRQFPRILFSHIPLYRPPYSSCGPRRNKAPIAPGRGVSYENLLSPELTKMIIDAVEPIHVFSGDDHTPCTYHHGAYNITEDSLATFSWLQGERNPEVSLLSLQGSPRTSPPMHIHTCALPDQMGIYLGLHHLHLPLHRRAFSYASIVLPIVAWYFVVLVLSVL